MPTHFKNVLIRYQAAFEHSQYVSDSKLKHGLALNYLNSLHKMNKCELSNREEYLNQVSDFIKKYKLQDIEWDEGNKKKFEQYTADLFDFRKGKNNKRSMNEYKESYQTFKNFASHLMIIAEIKMKLIMSHGAVLTIEECLFK